MSEQRNPSIPFSTFYHPPVELPEVMEKKGCGNHRNLAVMNALFSLVDFSETERINDKDYFTGITCVISHEGLGKRCFLSARRTADAIKELCASGLIEKSRIGKCYRYRITLYQNNIDYLKANPSHPHDTFAAPSGDPDKLKSIHDKASDIDDKASDNDPNSDAMTYPTRTERLINPDNSSDSQEQELKQDPHPNRVEGPNRERQPEPDGEGGDFKSSQKQKTEFDAEAIDVVPSYEIGEMVDLMAKEKGMNQGKEPDNDIDALVKLLKPDQAVVQWKDQQTATLLKERLIGVLSAASLDIPPLLFFRKYCIPDMDARIADGKLDIRPASPNFFLNTPMGRDIIESSIDKLSHENKNQREKERTQAYLDDMREKRDNRRPIPPEAQAELDRLLGRA